MINEIIIIWINKIRYLYRAWHFRCFHKGCQLLLNLEKYFFSIIFYPFQYTLDSFLSYSLKMKIDGFCLSQSRLILIYLKKVEQYYEDLTFLSLIIIEMSYENGTPCTFLSGCRDFVHILLKMGFLWRVLRLSLQYLN